MKNNEKKELSNSNKIGFKKGTNIFRVFYHIFGLIFPFGYLWVIEDRMTMSIIMLSLFAGFLIADIIRLSLKNVNRKITGILAGFMKSEEAERFSGSTYYTFACLICIFFLPKMIAIISIIFLCIGDPSASIIGRLYGRTKLFKGKKSLEGSLTMMIVNSIIGFVMLGPLVGIIGAITSAIVEVFPFHLILPEHYRWIDDNATIPIVSGFVMYLVSFI